MKKLLLLLVPLTLGLMVGCTYDDSAILDKIAEMEKEHDEMQAQLDTQQTLLDALANKLTITNIVPNTDGYTITFSDGATATIKNGKDGDSFFAEVVVGTTDVTFTLADGTVVVIPLGSGSGSGDTSAEGSKIYYTTSDGKRLFPYNTEPAAFGAILISNTYEDGQGVLTFDDTITSIRFEAFRDCTSLTSITIPDSVTEIGNTVFYGCYSLTSVHITDIAAWSGITFGDSSANPLCYAHNLYLNGELVTDLVIPDGVTKIGKGAFYGCTSLTSITIPDSVTEIGYQAFYNCTSLTSVTIGNGVTSIGWEAFYGCTGELIINSKIVETDYIFNRYPSDHGWLKGAKFSKLTIGNGVTSIGVYAFYNCTSLTSVTILDGVTSIGDEAFSNCTSLTSVTIPDSVTEIRGFSGCSSLTSITIPDSVTSIGGFSGCSSLTSITIPDSVTEIGTYAFYNCTSLTSVTIGNGVTSIGESTFSGCTSLTSVTIPDSVTEIGRSAFEDCTSLTSVTIGNGVTSIGEYAFYECSSLTSVYCKPTTPPCITITWYVFDGNASGRKIYVPTESVKAYKTAEFWGQYASAIVGYDF